MSKYIYGIDFGTTNSALAIFDQESNKVIKLFSTPSLLFFPEIQNRSVFETFFVGEQAIQEYVQSRMKGRFLKSIKKVLPNKSFMDTKIGNKRYKAEDLVALILLHLKKQADEFLGETIDRAIFGRPVVFDVVEEKDKLAQERLSKAARLAGFETFYFQMEPVGAAFAYERQIAKEEIVLVADFGGGTSDFSLMKLNPEAVNNTDRKGDMIAQGGIYIGGDSFESDIMWSKGTPHFGRGVKEQFSMGKWLDLPLTYFTSICSWEKMNFLDSLRMKTNIAKSYFLSGNDVRVKNLQTLIADNLGYVLFKEIERVKIELTEKDSSLFEFNRNEIELSEKIDLADFETEIIHKNLGSIEAYLETFLQENNIDKNQVDVVFMTGGTSQVRPLKNMFIRHFGQEKIKSGDNFYSVATGLAYSSLVFMKPETA